MRENAENGQNRGILDAAARKQDKRMASEPTLFLVTTARSADCIKGLRRHCDDVKRTNGQLRLEQKLRTQEPFDEWPD